LILKGLREIQAEKRQAIKSPHKAGVLSFVVIIIFCTKFVVVCTSQLKQYYCVIIII
jgi:hypothetical protein